MKRIFDITVVLVTAPFWLPVMVGVALLVRWKLGRPILFSQKRPGRDGCIFEIKKFRTMLNVTVDEKLLPDDSRLLPFGRKLRATSLDELPELFNVLRGEMSLVGPRPLLIQYMDRYNERQARRQEVRPGLTGLAQVKGRNALTWEEKFEWDVTYVETHSLWLDIKILAMTIGTVLFARGITSDGHATMAEFRHDGVRPLRGDRNRNQL